VLLLQYLPSVFSVVGRDLFKHLPILIVDFGQAVLGDRFHGGLDLIGGLLDLLSNRGFHHDFLLPEEVQNSPVELEILQRLFVREVCKNDVLLSRRAQELVVSCGLFLVELDCNLDCL
jgi:hypothetical protein